MKDKTYYKGFKIKKSKEEYKVYTRWMLFWWLPIQTSFGYYTFTRTDKIFKNIEEAKDFIDKNQ